MSQLRPIDCLRQLPPGKHDLLIEACEAIGFKSEGQPSATLVKWKDKTVASVIGDTVNLDSTHLPEVERSMDVITLEQGLALNRVLSKLERDKIAVHEAGHVIAAIKKGFKICFAVLGDESRVQICADHEGETPEDQQDYHAGGAAAEFLVFGNYRHHGVTADRNVVNAMESLRRQNNSELAAAPNDVFDTCVTRVVPLLSKESIITVAEALKARGFLSREEIEKLVEM